VIVSAAQLSVLLAALLLDRLVGDPPWLWNRLPHPVALIGRLIAACEARFNDPALSARTRRMRGALAVGGMVVGSALVGAAIAAVLSRLPLGWAIEAVLVAVLLAQKSLVNHVRAVATGLRSEDVEGGRNAVALIVGRDVQRLDGAGVARAATESAAENFSDGVVAPALWYALLGLPGLVVFKLANTADSMIGHRSPRYEAFGWAAARLDDLLNLVPARLSAVLIAVAATITGGDGRQAFRAAWRDSRLHKSPNAGWPEAAAAGALGLALGGPRKYGDALVDGAWLNRGGRAEAGPDDILRATRLIDAAWAVLAAAIAVAALATLWIGQ
jgi:adenosylcobinamide-phosphate synthase